MTSLPLLASQSVVTTGFLELAMPSGGNYIAGTKPMRWEARLHNFGTDVPFGAYGLLRLGGLAISGGGGTNSLSFGTLGSGGSDVLPSSGASVACCLNATGANGDIVLRLQRDTAGVNCGGSACYTFEACYTTGGYCTYGTIPITTVETVWASGAIYWLKPGADLAFVRWYSGVVAAGISGTGLLTPLSVIPPPNPSSLIGDWEFEGNLSDSSGNAAAWSTVSGVTTYATTPIYPPSCSAGSQQSVRAGSSLALNGTGQPLDGGSTLSYLWQQIAGVSPVPVQWVSSQRIYNPTAVLPQFGSYNFQLTVTDGSHQSTPCSVHDGAAPSDSNGVLLYPSGPLYSAANQFLGPLIQWSKNPWPWYDTSHKLAADTNLAALGPPAGNGVLEDSLIAAVTPSATSLPVANCNAWVGANTGVAVVVDSEQMLLGACTDSTHALIWQRGYRGTKASSHNSGAGVNEFWYWDWYDWNQGAGTVTVTDNSATITGVGTQFISGGNQAICNPDGTPTGANFLVIWHPTDTARTGRIIRWVSACASDTSATLSQPWGQGSEPVPAGSSLSYSIGTDFEVYWFSTQGNPWSVNYYDNVAGYYLLWLRSGIDTYLAAARQLADLVWYSPENDQGYAMMYDSRETGFPPRGASMLGLWLRQLDSPPVSMTTGLHRITESYMINQTYAETGVGDAREQGYQVATAAYTAALDTDTTLYNLTNWFGYYPGNLSGTTYANASLVFLSSVTSASGYLNYWYTNQNSYGDWPVLNFNDGDAYESPNNPGTSVTLTNGSTTVTGNSTTWNCSQLAEFTNLAIWFWHSAAASYPASNAAGDPTFYTITGCGSATQLTITPAYAGASCSNCGFEVSLNDGYVGWGNSGYAVGIGTRAMFYAASALTPTDPTDAATTKTVGVNASNWIRNRAQIAGIPGVAYGVDYVNCPYPPSVSNTACSKASSFSNVLGFSAEAADGWMSMYQATGDTATKTAMDAMYNQMWANPSVPCSGPCNTAVTASCSLPPCYMTQFDPSVNGFMLAPLGAGEPPPPKWFGQYFGFGDYSSWPAVRLGGAAASATQQVYITFSLASVANAANVLVAITAPNGITTSTSCTASPCAVTLPRADQPGYSIQLQYQSAGGAVLASSSRPLIESQ